MLEWWYKHISGDCTSRQTAILNIAIIIAEENPQIESVNQLIKMARDSTVDGTGGSK